MPGWHAKTTPLVRDHKLLVAGIAPEQHGDRMALFLQWKEMQDMPVMIDSFNLLGLKAVPTTLLIDEAGIIRHRNPSDQDLRDFLARPPAGVGTAPEAPRPAAALPTDGPGWMVPGASDLEALASRLDAGPDREQAAAHFQLGVAFRKRYDSEQRQASDFPSAVRHWTTALKLDPTNYIWRRRLQQYGPLLDKPYPFYNWIAQARREINARGGHPLPLVVEPGEAELAIPSQGLAAAGELPPHPDPDGKLPKDSAERFVVMTAVVPHTGKPDSVVRAFIEIQPNPVHRTIWNDEAGISTVHVTPPPGWSARPPVLVLAPAGTDPLRSSRRVEFEMHREDGGATGQAGAKAEIFLQACSGSEGLCQFLRRDVAISLRPAPAPPQPQP